MSSWGEHTSLATPNNVRGPPGDRTNPPGDHMIPPDRSATIDIEADYEPISLHEDTTSSTPSADKLPQAKALQVYIYTQAASTGCTSVIV